MNLENFQKAQELVQIISKFEKIIFDLKHKRCPIQVSAGGEQIQFGCYIGNKGGAGLSDFEVKGIEISEWLLSYYENLLTQAKTEFEAL